MNDLYEKGKTVAAIATPLGEGGVSVIRISGKEALEVGDQVFSGPVLSYATHTAHFGSVLNKRGKRVDQALVIVMKGPRSYTGEDTVEIQCHGGLVAAKAVLEVVLEAGATLAGPGEFTFKAFMNGKIDLAQAEAVQKVVGAKSDQAFELASQHLEGELSKRVGSYQKKLSHIAAIFEAWIDFPEEGLAFASFETLQKELKEVMDAISTLIATFEEGKKIEEGVSICIIGAPNVGKSSLMNALLKKERAIVTEQAGTTRDVLEENLNLNGLSFRLIDTAGIRETDEVIEKEGIRRARLTMERSDLILCVLDASRSLQGDEKALLKEIDPQKTLVIWNKTDLAKATENALQWEHMVSVSAKEKTGLEALKKGIDRLMWQGAIRGKDEVLLSSMRHKQALQEALTLLETVHNNFKGNQSPEYLSFDLRQALKALGKIIGTDVTEDILTEIFSKFCIGK